MIKIQKVQKSQKFFVTALVHRDNNPNLAIYTMFVWLISHQPAVLFSQNNQQHFSLTTNQHQPSAKRTGCM
jgi:hypothetical protein